MDRNTKQLRNERHSGNGWGPAGTGQRHARRLGMYYGIRMESNGGICLLSISRRNIAARADISVSRRLRALSVGVALPKTDSWNTLICLFDVIINAFR